MPVDLYCHIVAPFCRSVMLLAKALDVEVNFIETNILNREQYKPEFLALNPQHCIPTLVDGDVVVWESNAILMYLAEKYAKDDRIYYPKDIGERAKVNRLLFFQLGTLHRSISTYYFPILAGTGNGKPEDFRKIKDAVCILDMFLKGNKWLAGEKITVADFSIVINVAALEGVIKFDLTGYKNLYRWYQQCKEEIQGFAELTLDAVTKSVECFEALRRYKIQQSEEPCCISAKDSSCSKSDSSKPPTP